MKQLKNQYSQISRDQIIAATINITNNFEKSGLRIGYNGTTVNETIKHLECIYDWMPVREIFADSKLFTPNGDPGHFLLENQYAQKAEGDNTLEDGTVFIYYEFIISNKGLVFLHYFLCEYMQENMMYASLYPL